jgi:hypothetical protein
MHTEPNSDVNPEAVKQGFEQDTVHVRTILYVPIVLVIAFAFAFGTVTLIINYMREPSKTPPANALAAERDSAPLPERIERISSDPKEKPAYRQPRLDGLDRLKTNIDPMTNKPVPPWVESTQPTKTGNSPDYYPDAMWPSSEHGKDLGLQSYGWKDKEKGLVRIPIAEAMKLLAQGAADQGPEAKKLYEKVLKYENKVNPTEMKANQPKPSNPFWGIPVKGEAKVEPKGGGH